MESISGGEDCLEEEERVTDQGPAKKPSKKKKKKKKKKNKNSSAQVEASGSTQEIVSNVEEKQKAAEVPEVDTQHGDEKTSGGEDYLEEEERITAQESGKKPTKKRKKKKKKNKNSSTEESVYNFEETQQTDCKTVAEEKPEIDAQHGDEKDSSDDEGSSLLSNKDELKQHDVVGDVPDEKKLPNSSRGKSSKKRKKKDNVLAEEKEKDLVIPSEEVDKSDYTHEKRSDNETSSETPDLVPQKPCDEEKSNSPVINRKKKKKKKTGGFLLSDLDLNVPLNDSDKEKDDGKVVAEKQGKKLCDKNVTAITAERESDLAALTHDKSLLKLETREKNNFSKILIITNGLGLDTLRKVFQEIHPFWSNGPDYAKNMDKGKMILQNHEAARFDSGDINSWDISLITTVLLYSQKCHDAISKKKGFENAIRTIKDQKNELISHANSERMTDDEFNIAWNKMSKSLKTLGASKKDIDDAQSDDILEHAKFYRDLLLQEMASKDAVSQDINTMKTRMDNMGDEVAEKVVKKLAGKSSVKSENQPSLQDPRGPKWDEWIHFRDNVKDFDHNKNNYLLITDRMSPENVEHFSILRSVPWKIVLDFDFSSEERGMYHAFHSKDGQNSLVDMMTPNEIRRDHGCTVNLARHIDTRKTKWLFVKGRESDDLSDGGSQNLQDWKTSYLKHLSRFLSCCSEKIDKHKPVICVILPFHKETTPFLNVTLERLVENFDEFSLRFVGVKHDNIQELDVSLRHTDLSPRQLSEGLTNLLQVETGKEYRMPTFQAKLPVKLTNHQYLFLQEYLDVMYDGCEDLPTVNSEEDDVKLNKILNDHKESFLSGNWISFVSLYDNHDARRELSEEVRSHIQRLLEQGTHSTIIEIRHSPGTGGTTIARRVLWDLHQSYPCAIAKIEDFKFDFDDELVFINALADRISAMQDICNMIPLVLLGGNHSRIEHLSNKLVRVLKCRGQRAVLLSCTHHLTKASDNETNAETTDVHARYDVNVKLEKSLADLRQFQEKYKDFIDKFKKIDKWSPKRVFHFPLMAMLKGLEGFDSKLKYIIDESFDAMDGLQKEIAAVVAFIQIYASEATPASLLNKAFGQGGADKGITYEDINQLITDQLSSLMVPAKPSSAYESYTLQHLRVAEMVLQRYYETQKRNIFELTRDVLKFPIFEDGEFASFWFTLFIRKSSIPNARFSPLFEELNSLKAPVAAEIFRELADKTGDATVFAHAARFHAKSNPPLFSQAKDLIAGAFKCKNIQLKKNNRMVCEFKGNILQNELKTMVEENKIQSISKLEEVANEAVELYISSRSFPPTYPWPLMGEVRVWVSCIEWITKNKCNGDTNKAFEYITSEAPPFFHTCVGDSFYLLDLIDDIVPKEANVSEPEDVQRQSNNLRLSLLKTFKTDMVKRGKSRKASGRNDKDQDIIQECESLCSKKKFPKSSIFELKRLKVHYILASIDQIEAANNEIIGFLLKLLGELVFTDKQSLPIGMARHLTRYCLFSPKHYPLEEGLRVAEMWMKESSYDPLPYFYKMMIAFLMILDGNQISYREMYHKALDKCKEKSQNHCRRWVSTHFLRNAGEGMNRLMTKRALLSEETEYPQNIKDFWTTISRKKLKECTGRIKIRTKSGKRKQVYIELVEGNIELYVGKNADIGEVERDYPQGTIVHFVVSFTLEGPVANGITFNPTSSSVN